MPLACFQSHLTTNTTYGVAKSVSFDYDIALTVKILEDQGLGKRFSQLYRSLYSIES